MALWVPVALVSDPTWSSLLLLGLLAGILALDDTAMAQTWFGQPLPAAVLTGYLCGDPLTGLAVGLPLQLVLAGNLPIGQTFTGDSTSASIAAVAGAILAERHLPPVLVGNSAGTWQLLGWVILGASLLSLLGHLFIQGERRGQRHLDAARTAQPARRKIGTNRAAAYPLSADHFPAWIRFRNPVRSAHGQGVDSPFHPSSSNAPDRAGDVAPAAAGAWCRHHDRPVWIEIQLALGGRRYGLHFPGGPLCGLTFYPRGAL